MAERLRREFLDLLERDREFRYAVTGYLGLSETLEESQKRIWEEIRRIHQEIRRIQEEIRDIRKEQGRTWEEIRRL